MSAFECLPRNRHSNHGGSITEKCKSCLDGYRLNSNDVCVPNICTCSNGINAVGVDNGIVLCPEHNIEVCQSCNRGYHLSLKKCVPNQCVCLNGAPTEAEDCKFHGDFNCDRCSAGYHKVTQSISDSSSADYEINFCEINKCQSRLCEGLKRS